jgi:hypothetical protein
MNIWRRGESIYKFFLSLYRAHSNIHPSNKTHRCDESFVVRRRNRAAHPSRARRNVGPLPALGAREQHAELRLPHVPSELSTRHPRRLPIRPPPPQLGVVPQPLRRVRERLVGAAQLQEELRGLGPPYTSGWHCSASRRYARLISSAPMAGECSSDSTL